MSDDCGADKLPFIDSRRAENVNFDLYRHTVHDRVRNFECDRQSIVHNVAYLYWLEAARIEYFRDIGLKIDQDTFIANHHFVVARLETDYLSAAAFDDRYDVLTRTIVLGNSSFRMRQLVRLASGRLLLKADAVLVHLNTESRRPEPLPESFCNRVRQFEGRIGENNEWEYIG